MANISKATQEFIGKIKKDDIIDVLNYVIAYIGDYETDEGDKIAVFYKRGGTKKVFANDDGSTINKWKDEEIRIPYNHLSKLKKRIDAYDSKNTWLGKIVQSSFENGINKITIVVPIYENKHVISDYKKLIEFTSNASDDDYVKLLDISRRYTRISDMSSTESEDEKHLILIIDE